METKKQKKDLHFPNEASLRQVEYILKEASLALNHRKRTIAQCAISDLLKSAEVIGMGGLMAGLFPEKALGMMPTSSGLVVVGMAMAASQLQKQFYRKKAALCAQAEQKHQDLQTALREETEATQARVDYLRSLSVLLDQVIRYLKEDLENT